MTLQQKAQEYVEASGLSLKTDKGEQAYNAYIAGAKENMEGLLEWMKQERIEMVGGNTCWLRTTPQGLWETKTLIQEYLKQQE